MNTYFAEVCLNKFQIQGQGQEIIAQLEPLKRFATQGYDEIIFRKRNEDNGALICSTHTYFKIKVEILKSFCCVAMLLSLKQQRISFIVEIDTGAVEEIEIDETKQKCYVITKMTFA